MRKFEIKIDIEGKTVYTVNGDLDQPEDCMWTTRSTLTDDQNVIVGESIEVLDAVQALRNALFQSEKAKYERKRKRLIDSLL